MKAPPMIVSIFHIAHEVFEFFKLKIIQKPIRNFKTDKKIPIYKDKTASPVFGNKLRNLQAGFCVS